MIKIEGSIDGKNWVLFRKVEDIEAARNVASKCILYTKHTQVRITGASQ